MTASIPSKPSVILVIPKLSVRPLRSLSICPLGALSLRASQLHLVWDLHGVAAGVDVVRVDPALKHGVGVDPLDPTLSR